MIIETSSRLHFGIIDMSREFKRGYGALGTMIKGGFRIEIQRSKNHNSIVVEGEDEVIKEVKTIYKRLVSEYDIKHGYDINVIRQVPRHIGLGSTTQLHMGVGMGLLNAEGQEAGLKKIASVVGRSRYSAIGTYGFEYGGFILEGGKSRANEVPPITARYEMPEDWRFLIVCLEDIKGYDEVQEKPILKKMKVDVEFAKGISHHIVMGILPSIKTRDIVDFGYHLYQIQRLVGLSFSPYQGGIFHPAIEDVIRELNETTYGAGQSSWGPTAYGLTDIENIDSVKDNICEWLDEHDKKAKVWVGVPENSGYRVIDG